MLIHLDVTDSTNEYLKREDLPHGTIVWADRQTAGKGRGDHSFESPAGGIYFSCLLKALSPEDALLLTPKAAVAVCIALEELLRLEPKIKWVNDILLRDKKVCGILCEHYKDMYIAGIGINVSSAYLPEELQSIAGGICDASGEEMTYEQKETLVRRISEILSAPMEKDCLIIEYEKSLNVLGKTVRFTLDGKEKTGACAGINEYCNLIIKTDQGTVTLTSGEISLS